MVGLDRRHQYQVGLERVNAFEIRLHDGAQVADALVILVAREEMRHIILHHAGHGHTQLVEEIDFIHVEHGHPLRPMLDQRRAQLVHDGDGRRCLLRRGRGRL